MSRSNTRVARPFLQGPWPLAFGHRGGAKLWPENTMVAFEGAVGLGCPYLETDLRISRDGVLVTFHDETLHRTTDGSGPVRACTLDELKRLDAGYHFTSDGGHTFPFRGKKLAIPTLAEVAHAFPDVGLNVDMKENDPALADALAVFIEEHGVRDRILVASFYDGLLKEFRRRMGDSVATSAASWETRRFWLASRLGMARLLHTPYDALQVPHRMGWLTVVDRRFIAAAHRAGLHVHVWTVDEPPEMRYLLDLGVDGLMSDRPDLLCQVLQGSQGH